MKRILSIIIISAAAVANALSGEEVISASVAAIIQSVISLAAVIAGQIKDEKRTREIFNRTYRGKI